MRGKATRIGCEYKNCDLDRQKKLFKELQKVCKKIMGKKIKNETFELEKR